MTRTYATFLNVPVVFANRVGFEDGVNFWGGSAIVGAGRLVAGAGPGVRGGPDLAVHRPAGHPPRAHPRPMHRDERVHLTLEELERIRHESYRSDTCR